MVGWGWGRGGSVCSLANYSIAYEETQSTDFRGFVCSLFPKAILFDFIMCSLFPKAILFYFIMCSLFPKAILFDFIMSPTMVVVVEGGTYCFLVRCVFVDLLIEWTYFSQTYTNISLRCGKMLIRFW